MKLIDIKGEGVTKDILSGFSCPLAPDVENFVRRKAIEFAKQGWAQTHLVFAPYKKENVLVGYFALASKSINVQKKKISVSTRKRIAKFSTFDNTINVFHLSAPLIAQLGKNFFNKYNNLITGDELLDIACQKVSQIQLELGGRFAYIECEDTPKLIEFYSRNGFVEFDRRQLDKDEIDSFSSKELVQMLRKMKQKD